MIKSPRGLFDLLGQWPKAMARGQTMTFVPSSLFFFCFQAMSPVLGAFANSVRHDKRALSRSYAYALPSIASLLSSVHNLQGEV